MSLNKSSLIQSGLTLSRQLFIYCLLISALSTPLRSLSDQKETSDTYHKLITQLFPEMDTAIFEALEPPGSTDTDVALKKVTTTAYRKWYAKVQGLKNSPVPPNALLLIKHLVPDGFDFVMKRHLYQAPQVDGYSEAELVTHYLLQIFGAAIKQNQLLKPVEEELIELFQCNNKDCEQQAGIYEPGATPLSTSDEIKRQLFVDCALRTGSLFENRKQDFCDAFLLQIIY